MDTDPQFPNPVELVLVSVVSLVALLLLTLMIGASGVAQAASARGFDWSQWKITLPDGSERDTQWLLDGGTVDGEFFYRTDGAVVFRTPTRAGTTTNSRYSRSELRQMLMGVSVASNTRGVNPNNWVFSASSPEVKARAGAVDGRLRATLQVDHVSTTGLAEEVGTIVIGQIHASDDEPMRLHYRKLPGNERGSIYFAHEIPQGKDTWFELLGSRADSAEDPSDGIPLGERFSYDVKVEGLALTVTIEREGRDPVSTTINMREGYTDDWMYFKAGVYNQSRVDETPDQSDFAQATFYSIEVSH